MKYSKNIYLDYLCSAEPLIIYIFRYYTTPRIGARIRDFTRKCMAENKKLTKLEHVLGLGQLLSNEPIVVVRSVTGPNK